MSQLKPIPDVISSGHVADPGLGLSENNLDELLAPLGEEDEFDVTLVGVVSSGAVEAGPLLEAEGSLGRSVEAEGPMLCENLPIQIEERGLRQTARVTAGKHSNPYHLPRSTASVESVQLGQEPSVDPCQSGQNEYCPFHPWM